MYLDQTVLETIAYVLSVWLLCIKCTVFNPIMVECYAALFSCTAVVQASDSMTASM